MVLERFGLRRLARIDRRQMMIVCKTRRNAQSGVTMVEVMLASAILLISSLSIIALILTSIATNNRNKLDSTTAMLGL